MISIIVDNIKLEIEKIKFSDGGSNLKLIAPKELIDYPPSSYYSIVVEPETPVDNYLWEILQAVDAIEQTFGEIFKRELLYLPYLPHARADRVFEYGNGFSLKLFLEAVSWMFDTIFLTDPHSDFYKQYDGDSVNRKTPCFEVTQQHHCFIEKCGRLVTSGDVLVSPDKGSLSKIYKLQKALDVRTISTFVLEASKKRDITSGKILETTLPDDFDLQGKTCWIVDDIADGAGTFIPLANKLKERGAKQVNLYVTHGIFAKGLDILKPSIDNVYCYQTVSNYVKQSDLHQFNKGEIQ